MTRERPSFVLHSEMAKLLQSTMGSMHIKRIKALPHQEQILLTALAAYFKVHKAVTINAFESWCKDFSAEQSLPAKAIATMRNSDGFCVNDLCFVDLLTGIAESGLIVLTNSKQAFRRKIQPSARFADIQFAVRQIPYFKSVLDEFARSENNK